MKKLTLLLLAGIAFSCNDAGTSSKEAMKDSSAIAVDTSTTMMNYPYTVKKPDNWEVGSTANSMIALQSLKAWEEGKMDEALKYFGDSIWLQFDALDKKMPNDSLKAMFTSSWNAYKTVKVTMNDFESVISKDKSEEWVTLWYTQSWETKKGVKDSSSVINDLQIKDGKIVRLAEHIRKLH
ncbi:MAG: hypothetical protein ABIQ31_04420 [Ferruginibacter sp.]